MSPHAVICLTVAQVAGGALVSCTTYTRTVRCRGESTRPPLHALKHQQISSSDHPSPHPFTLPFNPRHSALASHPPPAKKRKQNNSWHLTPFLSDAGRSLVVWTSHVRGMAARAGAAAYIIVMNFDTVLLFCVCAIALTLLSVPSGYTWLSRV